MKKTRALPNAAQCSCFLCLDEAQGCIVTNHLVVLVGEDLLTTLAAGHAAVMIVSMRWLENVCNWV